MPHARIVTDDDITDYATYVAKLAAIAAPGDPPPARFRSRFQWAHGTTPQDHLIGAPAKAA